MNYQKMNLFCSKSIQCRLYIERPGIAGNNWRAYRVPVFFLADNVFGADCDFGVQFDPDAVPSEPAAFDQRGPASDKGIEDPISLLCVPEHQLMGNLRNEIAPIPGKMGSGRVAFGQDPEAVGDDLGLLFPTV